MAGCIYSDDHGQTWETVWELDQLGGYMDIALMDGQLYAFRERDVGIVENLALRISRPVK